MKIQINAADIQQLEKLIDSPERRAMYLEAKFIETRQSFWLSFGPSIQREFDKQASRA